MARRASLRASDADRDQVAERLRTAAAEGRLLAHEFEQRLATALRARTYGELDSVVADLPSERGVQRPARNRRPRTRRSVSAPHPAMIAALVIAVPVVVAAVIAAIVLMVALAIFWTVLAALTWKVLGRRGLPGPWILATRHRRRRVTRSHRDAVGSFVPWL